MNNQTKLWSEVYPNFRECSIQTFNDKDKEEHSQSRILPMTEENLEKCEKLQKLLPYGIYFSVNPMESGKRDKSSVKKIQTWICDIDDQDKEHQLELISKAKLKPTLVVESVHGFHLYYLAKEPLTEEEFENGNRGLKNYFNGDPKVCRDTARVLRIPGFFHMKGEPILEQFRQDLSLGDYYTVEQMEEAFPNQSDTTPGRVKQRTQLNEFLNEEDHFREKAAELDTKGMLEELSGSSRVGGDLISFKRNSNGTEQIYCNGKSTGCRLDKSGLIGSADKGGPTRIQRLKWYGLVDWKQLAEYLKERHPELTEKKAIKLNTEDYIYKPNEVPRLEKPSFSWGDTLLDNQIGKLKRGQMVILCGETGAGKTTFATFMARKNKGCCYYVLEDKVENIAMRYAIKYAGITKEEYNEGTWSSYKETKYEEGYLRFRNKDLLMVDIGHKITVDTLIASMKEMKEKGCGLFFIDNLGFVIGDGQDEARQTADVSSKLVSFCLNENVCIVLLHHFKKRAGVLVRDIGQMRGSGKLGDDAFMVVEYVRDGENTSLRVYKDRNWGDLSEYVLRFELGEFTFLKKEIW